MPIIALNWRRFPLTRLLCWLLVAHALVLIHGGAYTYAETPLGFWLRDAFAALGLEVTRNPWDRVGHLMQGFVPAILARELLLRCTPLRRGGWLVYLVLAACLSFSAFFELIEWWAALIYGADADAFLATQGDQWDTQWDMFLCLCGAALSLLLWSRLHDRQLGLPA
jgi:putative membrane protein